MQATDRSLVNFLNHGLLPFTGRSAEIERIEEFWRGTSQAPGLRAMLVTGEAGIGKSRLIEEVTRRIAAAGGVVVQLRLYPDSTTSIIPMLAGALARSATAQQLLRSDPDETMSAVSSALIRVSGLRPTLLVIEDFHLLASGTLTDFAMLLDRLIDEPLSLLVAARPVELTTRGLLERCLVDEMELEGLSDGDVSELCRTLFGAESVDGQVVKVLREKTLGNTLALRSALRGAVKSGAVSVNQGKGAQMPVVDQRTFVGALERNVRLLSEGMVAHLSDAEKRAAGSLACLGEVFARESAAMMLADADPMLDILIFKGILHTPPTPPVPLPDAESRTGPLAFTHTLLHRYFVECTAVDVDTLVQVLADELPIYSIVPYQLAGEHAAEVRLPALSVLHAINRALRTTVLVDDSPDWKLGAGLVDVAEKLYRHAKEAMTPDEARMTATRLISHRLNTQRRDPNVDYESLVLQFDKATVDPQDDAWAELRLTALIYLRRYRRRRETSRVSELWEDMEELLRRFPGLVLMRSYLGFLRDTVREAISARDRATWRRVEERFKAILTDENATETVRRTALRILSPAMLVLFDSEEELRERLTFLEELEREEDLVTSDLRIWKIALLLEIGQIEKMLDTISIFTPLFQERGLQSELVSCVMLGTYGKVLMGADFTEGLNQVHDIANRLPSLMRPRFMESCFHLFGGAALLRANTEELATAHKLFESKPAGLRLSRRILFALATGDRTALPEILAQVNPMHEGADDLPAILAAAVDPNPETISDARQHLERLFAGSILTTEDLLVRRAAIDLSEVIGESDAGREMAKEIRPAVREVVEKMLAWLEERRVTIPMTALLGRYAAYFTKNTLTPMRARIAAVARERESERPDAGEESRVRVTMFGTITIQLPGQQPARLRGAQLCTLLGLMTADHLLARPLSHREFTSIAIGLERDPDKLRKSINFAVFRLRESLGSDAVDTSGETPLLRLDLVSVDLIDAHRHLRTAVDSTRDGALLRAVPELIQALAISRGEVPFPTLYDEFFESAREDFENELRKAVVRLSRALLREEDAESAEELLERGFEAMPDDEEIAELLREALRKLGKRTEATRVGLKVAEALDE